MVGAFGLLTARRITLALWARAPASTSIQARDCIAQA